MNDFHERIFGIGFGHCDEFGFMKVHELFRMMQECAAEHAEMLGVGMEAMKRRNNGSFVLSRMRIDVDSMPRSGDRLNIKTYPVGTDRLFYIRDFEICVDKMPSARARTCWLVINLESRRPLRDRSLASGIPVYGGGSIDSSAPARPEASKDLPELLSVRAGYSDVDVLGHVNNTRYVEWVCNALGSVFFKGGGGYSMVVNYASELNEGDVVSIRGGDGVFMGINNNGVESFTAKAERR
ncbi:MAG: hypothetical protein JXB33_08755 [Clostridia bacterium]|nr:hypothetical protein [Clostridia bacterium]